MIPIFVALLTQADIEVEVENVLSVLHEFVPADTWFVALNDGRTNLILSAQHRGHPLVQSGTVTPLSEAYCRLVVDAGDTVMVPDTMTDSRTKDLLPTTHLGSTQFFGVPLRWRNGHIIGTLCALNRNALPWTPGQRRVVQTVAQLLGMALELGWRSYCDPMTQVGNRRLYNWFRDDQAPACQRKTVLFCDMDNLKQLNDRAGHQIGDAAIQTLVEILVAVVGDAGVVCRTGGDEFVVLGPDVPLALAVAWGERILALLEERPRTRKDVPPVQVTLGIASLAPGSWATAIDAADRAMYRAKRRAKGTLAVARER